MYGDVMDGNGSDLVHDCVDRHVEAGLGARVAIHFEGGPGGGRSLTYARLQDEVARAAEALSGLGVGAGDRVTLRAAATPEAVVALLACALVGADPSVSPGPPEAVAPDGEGGDDALAVRRRERAGRAGAGSGTGSDACRCGGTEVEPVAEERAADGTLAGASRVRSLRVRRTCRCRFELGATARRNLGLGDPGADPARRRVDSAPPAPPGAYGPARHGSEADVYWSRVTEGWGSGLPAGVRGPLTAGATQVIHAGAQGALHEEELWATVQKYRVSVLYTAPEDIRTLMLWGDEIATRHDLSSLCVLGTVGARSGTEGWIWYRDPAEDGAAEDGAQGEPGRWELRTCSTPWAAPTPERRGRDRLYVVR